MLLDYARKMRPATCLIRDSAKGARFNSLCRVPESIASTVGARIFWGLVAMTEEYSREKRRYPRISLPKGMWAAWYGGEKHQVSRVRTLGMGGAFISVPDPPPVDTHLRLAFEVPTGYVQAEAIVRSIQPGEGMGIEFTKIGYKERLLLKRLLKRLLS